MSSLPLHPVFVHVPLGLAAVLPALAFGFLWALWTGRIRSRGWLVIIALQAVLLGAGWLAMNTGEREEDRVEKIVPKAALSTHESRAEQFVVAAGVTFAVAALVPIVRRREFERACAVASVAGTLVVAGLAVRVGHAGGQLVYTHNAGAAYATASTGAGKTDVPRAAGSERGRGDDDDR